MTSPDLDQQIQAVLNGYDHDAAGQIDDLTSAIRDVLTLCEDEDDAPPEVRVVLAMIRNVIALRLGVIDGSTVERDVHDFAIKLGIHPTGDQP